MNMSPSRALFVATIALALAACHSRKEPGATETLPSVAVRTAVVESEVRPSIEEVVGTVRSKQRAVIEAKVSGRILQYLAVPGQMVKSGDLLVEVDALEILARRDRATAMLDEAVKDMARYEKLISSNAISRQDYDAAASRQAVARAALSEAETMLGYARVTAPFDGVITRKLADVGDLAMPGKPLIEMEAPGFLRFEADVPESLIGDLKLGAKLPVRIGANPATIEGTVVEIAPIADPASRTFLVKLDLPATEGLRSGQFGRVLVPVGETRSIYVPRSALVVRGQMETVFVVDNQKARLRIVRTGKKSDGEVELISGIDPGDRVVVEGTENLSDGQPVTMKP